MGEPRLSMASMGSLKRERRAWMKYVVKGITGSDELATLIRKRKIGSVATSILGENLLQWEA
jgi:hypothetical protein